MREPVESVEADEPDAYDMFEMFRVVCPDCAQPIALLADEEFLPEHALCPTPWNPFVLSVCSGAGRPVDDARPVDEEGPESQEGEMGVLLTLPQGIDWRTQPFSHVGGPGSRPIKVRLPRLRDAAPRLGRAA
ncbi:MULTISPECIES: hypothetical protein [Streptomyces]|jgi:hypothetical protein|uniref:Uncharacterized protein n=2 Tax=Streptomyces TaxID=1883 RepID=A0A1D8FXF2_9ACTN|nr:MULTISPECIES: hypothetical protein [Streptomyces]AOT57878.1 hypothetical protein A4G23_00674 [Streptomyces rubrolavendulae]KAF0648312.1 hypothetical protein K701_18865 [Streptomyces fradiae ATCC 10745 = DSM 40063]OSY52387.1 hypothetical protein BG846_01962 [Streptomyces fradiae ATCC 10745 = DSM 40063]QEV11234.1 hypothetical protein CP974_03545 [Streptomyces fradiae ATCC 10745 = DSM 40063]UQS29072.1 hypothetical protein J5J01_18940 [Streptomyces fradiae]